MVVGRFAETNTEDSLLIRGYFGEGAEADGLLPNERRFDLFRSDGAHAGSITLRLTGETSSEMKTPWGNVTIQYEGKPQNQYRILKERTPVAIATSNALRPIAFAFQNGQELVFKQKPWRLRFQSKSKLGHFVIEYGGLHPDDPVLQKAKIFLHESGRGRTHLRPGYRAWKVSILDNSGVDRDTFFSVLSAFTCHFYFQLSREPSTMGAAAWLPVEG